MHPCISHAKLNLSLSRRHLELCRGLREQPLFDWHAIQINCIMLCVGLGSKHAAAVYSRFSLNHFVNWPLSASASVASFPLQASYMAWERASGGYTYNYSLYSVSTPAVHITIQNVPS